MNVPQRYSRRRILKGLGGSLLGLSLLPNPVFAAETVRVRSGGSIQAGVNAVAAGGTVIVEPGVYVETVVIEKPLRLVSEVGFERTVIQADQSRFVWSGLPREKYIVGAVNVRNTKDVLIDGFTLLDALEGLWVSASQRVLVQHCMSCGHLSSGYYFWASQASSLLNSEASANAVGVYQGASVDITILNNLFSANHGGRVPHLDNAEFPGIGILAGNFSVGCQVVGNHSVNNRDWGVGVSTGVTRVNIVNNEIRDNQTGVFVGEKRTLVKRNNLVGNARLGVDAGLETDVTENWWGDASGPSGTGPGRGDAVTGAALIEPWLLEPLDIPKGFVTS